MSEWFWIYLIILALSGGFYLGFWCGGQMWKALHQETVKRWDSEAKQRIELEQKLLTASIENFTLRKRACAMSMN
jgi:hypothetical protein